MNNPIIKAKVLLYTFPDGQTSGSCLPVATLETDVEIVFEQMSPLTGTCFSPEIKLVTTAVVTINGRRFMAEKSYFDNTVDFKVAIPQDLAKTLKFCKCCKTLIDMPVATPETIPANALRVFVLHYGHTYVCEGRAFATLNDLTGALNSWQKPRPVWLEYVPEGSPVEHFYNIQFEKGTLARPVRK